MYRLAPLGLILGVLFFAASASAALPPTTPSYYTSSQARSDVNGITVNAPTNCPAAANTSGQCTSASPCTSSDKKVTFYVPHQAANCRTSIEGCIETSRLSLNGHCVPVTLDAIRLGKAKYATCASDPSNYGKYFNMGTITYRSALDMKTYTVPNVTCYVHDTGSAFNGNPTKLDLATTVCPTCTDTQAGVIGVGGMVAIAGIGPVDVGYPTGIGAGQILSQDYYCIVSIEPVIVHPVPAGTPFPSNCYNSPGANRALAQRPPPPPVSYSQPSIAQQIGQRISQFLFGNASSSAQVINPQKLLIAQPTNVKKGNPVLVSWSSVGMNSQTPCQISENGQSLAQSNAGSKIIQTTSLQTGALTFALSCTTQAGLQMQQSASVNIN